MTDMLEMIYNSDAFFERPPSEKYFALSREESKVWEKIRPLIGRELSDELNAALTQSAQQANLDWFRQGFRLGASLMLELMG